MVEKENPDRKKNLPSSNNEMILLQTAEVHVASKRNNKEIKLKLLFDSGSKKSFLSQCHNIQCVIY